MLWHERQAAWTSQSRWRTVTHPGWPGSIRNDADSGVIYVGVQTLREAGMSRTRPITRSPAAMRDLCVERRRCA